MGDSILRPLSTASLPFGGRKSFCTSLPVYEYGDRENSQRIVVSMINPIQQATAGLKLD